MKEACEEIRITDLDIDMTRPSQEAPGFRRLYLKNFPRCCATSSRTWISGRQRKRPCERHLIVFPSGGVLGLLGLLGLRIDTLPKSDMLIYDLALFPGRLPRCP